MHNSPKHFTFSSAHRSPCPLGNRFSMETDDSSMSISSGESPPSSPDRPVSRSVSSSSDDSSTSEGERSSEAPYKKMVQRLWKTGEYSDLTIMTVDRQFKVHKNIICPASCYFKAVCSEELNETPPNSIGVSEPASVIKELLRAIYGYSPNVAKLLEDPVAAIRHLCEVLTAANKYQITRIEDQLYGAIPAMAFEKREYPHAHRIIIAIGQVLFEYRKIVALVTLQWYAGWTTKFFGCILYDDVGWQLLTLSPDYYKEVMREAYEVYHELAGEPVSSLEEMISSLSIEDGWEGRKTLMQRFLKRGQEQSGVA
ncbi:hypothetical protein AC579_4250 [Pseudocercospora musae]|uniref:BTB domain-containing protein n=1 Tax=Pseudocercospora musae TaxID=113226 RepID=A0A139IFD6_9PEZI|nr:hypothetical protein AC579_4250 [Pseudocercospora musae]